MRKRNAARWILWSLAILIGVLGGFWLLSAMVTAEMRFGDCGPSTIGHVDSYCQVATRLLYGSYIALAVAGLLLVVGFYVGRGNRHAA